MFVPAANQQTYSNLHSSQQYTLRAGLSSSSSHGAAGSDAGASVGSSHRQDAFERTLSMGYIKLQESFSSKVEGPAAAFDTGALTAEKVSSNILGFIERRLAMDKAEGASEEALASRLEAGLSGFKKGFAEAEEQLKALNMLTPVIAEDIGETYDLVMAGIDGLREKFLGEIPAADKPDDVKSPKNQFESTEGLARASMMAGQYDYARANSFSFTLKTADGDTVTIDASAAQSFSFGERYTQEQGEQNYSASLSASHSRSEGFNLSIDGELDEGELTAINALLGQVNNLADDFFAGDLDSAFNAALELGYDSTEITSYALSLTQVEVQRVSQAYQQPIPNSDNAPAFNDIGKFAQDLLGAMDVAKMFDEPVSLIEQLTEQLSELHGDTDRRLPSFMDRMLGDLNLREA